MQGWQGSVTDMLTEEDMVVLFGTKEKPGFYCKARAARA